MIYRKKEFLRALSKNSKKTREIFRVKAQALTNPKLRSKKPKPKKPPQKPGPEPSQAPGSRSGTKTRYQGTSREKKYSVKLTQKLKGQNEKLSG
jgi:hypothetical protein